MPRHSAASAASVSVLALIATLTAPAASAAAQQRPTAQQQQRSQAAPAAAAPRRLGTFGEWTAATYTDDGQKICYAFTPASRSEPRRDGVMLMVTQRGASRDEVAIRTGHSYARGTPDITVAVGSTELDFYTGSDTAHARDRRAAVAAFRAGREAVARGPGPNGRGNTTDTFSLSGFSAAHDAISRECPAPGGRR
jgi:hypothetical protein